MKEHVQIEKPGPSDSKSDQGGVKLRFQLAPDSTQSSVELISREAAKRLVVDLLAFLLK